MDKITGSGVMIFIKQENETLVLLMQTYSDKKLVLQEPGGRMSKGLSYAHNALKELYEETFASLSRESLEQIENVLVHERYICYGLYIKINDLKFFQEVMTMNQKTISKSDSRALHCYNESKGLELVNLKELASVDFQYIKKGEQTIPVHGRTKQGLREFVGKQIIQPDFSIKLPLYQCYLDKIRIKDQKSPLFILNNQFTYIIE